MCLARLSTTAGQIIQICRTAEQANRDTQTSTIGILFNDSHNFMLKEHTSERLEIKTFLKLEGLPPWYSIFQII